MTIDNVTQPQPEQNNPTYETVNNKNKNNSYITLHNVKQPSHEQNPDYVHIGKFHLDPNKKNVTHIQVAEANLNNIHNGLNKPKQGGSKYKTFKKTFKKRKSKNRK